MTILAAHPTLIVALGDSAAPVLELLRALDDGIDLEPERGLRVLLEEGRGAVFGELVACQRSEMPALIGAMLAELRETACAQVVQAKSGIRLVLVCDESDLAGAVELLSMAWTTAPVRHHCASLADRGGVQVRLVIGCEAAEAAIANWQGMLAVVAKNADSGPGLLPRILPLAVSRKRDHYSLEAPAHVLSMALALRILVTAATQEVEEALGFAGHAAREWLPTELVDLAKSLEEERRRHRFGVWLEELVNRPATVTAYSDPPTTALLRQAVGAVPMEMPALQHLRNECDALTKAAGEIATNLAARATDGALLGEQNWPADVEGQLRTQLTEALEGKGEAAGRKFAMALDGQEHLDKQWIDNLHERLGFCGTAALLAHLEAALATLTSSAERLPQPNRQQVDNGGGLAGALAAEQGRWQREIGPAPPGFLHWMALPWLAMGAVSAPVWHAAAVEYGPVNPATQSPAVQQLHHTVDLVARSDWTVALAALCGLATWAVVSWWQQRRWRQAQLRFAERVAALLVETATRRGELADREQQLAWARAIRVMHRCASSAEHAIQRVQQQIRRSEPVIRWLVRRVQGRRHPVSAGTAWSIDVQTPEVTWLCVPPQAQEDREEASHEFGPSPWQHMAAVGGPHQPEKVEALLLDPARVLKIWQENGGQQLVGQDHKPEMNAVRGAVALDVKPARLHAASGWSVKVFQMWTQELEGELTRRVSDETAKRLLVPAGAGVPTSIRCSSQSLGDDRMIVLQQATLVEAEERQGGA